MNRCLFKINPIMLFNQIKINYTFSYFKNLNLNNNLFKIFENKYNNILNITVKKQKKTKVKKHQRKQKRKLLKRKSKSKQEKRNL